MTLEEFSREFDVLYNNISSNQAPGLTEYEKSILLTQSRDDIILELYRGNRIDSYENTEEVSRYISSLVKTKTIPAIEKYSSEFNNLHCYIASSEGILFIVREKVLVDEKPIQVVPTRYDELNVIKDNPFRGPNKKRVLRVYSQEGIRLYTSVKDTTMDYVVDFIPKLKPIILEGVDLSIEGYTYDDITDKDIKPYECLHKAILTRAVGTAKALWA